MIREFGTALRMMFLMTLLLGGLYPVLMTGAAEAMFPSSASGSLIERDGRVVGSELIAQKFTQEGFFWPRPSAVDFNPLPSGGSNLSPVAKQLRERWSERRALFAGRDDVPQELLFASASGLDPHLSPAGALFQVPRVARARGVAEERLKQLVRDHTEGPQWGFLGESRVNVLKLNLALLDLLSERTP
ncbi:MAG: potassium-transporting ATPase subunit KdpC [Bdellovibrionaceae bacterium]|nr:potassium-transporting ATPase subunit KdpC [Pseudobdellovibrionaceae bacterium]